MSSLRARLTVGVVTVIVLALTAFSALLYWNLSRSLWRQFDERLAGDVLVIAGATEDQVDDWDFEYPHTPEFERTDRPAYFEVWAPDRTVIARSGSLQSHDLTVPAGAFGDTPLPDGRPGRFARVVTPARPEEAGNAPRNVEGVLLRETTEITEALAELRWVLILLTAVTSLLAGLVGALAVARGLKPAQTLATQLDALDAKRLGAALTIEGLPDELKPVVQTLNQALARLDTAFNRERQFTADVSHELRTPLAALKTTLEVAASRERNADEYRQVLSDAIGLTQSLESMVQSLLALARLDAGQLQLHKETVHLRELGQTSWQSFSTLAARRGLRFVNRIGPELTVQSDPAKLKVVLDTLLSNAASHTAENGEVVLDGDPKGAWLEVWDSGPAIDAALLPQVFERFVRGDQARASGEHTGIGLSLARAMADALGLTVQAENVHGGPKFWVRPDRTG